MTRRTAWLPLALFLLPAFGFAQTETLNPDMIRKIKEEETNRSHIPEIARGLLDDGGPRLTNSPGYRKAVAWCVDRLKSWGIANAGPEAWGQFGRGWASNHYSLAIASPYYQPLAAIPNAWTNGTKGPVTADLIRLRGNIDSAAIDRIGDSVRGKIVLVETYRPGRDRFERSEGRLADTSLPNLPESYMFPADTIRKYMPFIRGRYYNLKYLESKGAVAFLEPSWSEMLDNVVTVSGGTSYNPAYPPILPVMNLAREDYLRINRMLEDHVPVKLTLDVDNTFYDDDLTGYNVVGEIPGTDPKLKSQVVMLGGHLDSWHAATGATDNGAGCIVMLEVMRLFRTLGIQPRRTIRIGLWGGEEQGEYGSIGYVLKHFGDPKDMKLKPEQKLISAYFNLDNGTGRIRGVYAQNNGKVKPIFEQWLKPFADSGALAVTLSPTGSTDHESFDAVGIPGFQFIQDPLDYESFTHHTNQDTYDHLVMDDLKQAAIVVAGFVYQAAMRDEMLPRKPLPKPGEAVFDYGFPF